LCQVSAQWRAGERNDVNELSSESYVHASGSGEIEVRNELNCSVLTSKFTSCDTECRQVTNVNERGTSLNSWKVELDILHITVPKNATLSLAS
jgi:hypothetical protein